MMDTCKFCYRPMTEEILKEKQKRKIDNARASVAKAKANGNRLGRRKIRDDNQIRALRREGLSIRDIAAKIGLSTAAVQNGLKGAK